MKRHNLTGMLVRKERSEVPDLTQAVMKFVPASEVELAALGDKPEGYVAGWASTPDLDYYDHVVAAGAFSQSIATRGLVGPQGIKFLIGHDSNKIGGIITVLEYRGERLWLEAQYNLELSYAKDAWLAAKMVGGVNFSVGFYIQDYEFKEDANKNEYLLIKRGDLFEVSAVTFPANDACNMVTIKDRDAPPKSFAELEKMLVSLGLVKSRNDAHKVTELMKKSSALLMKAPPPKEDPPTPMPMIGKERLDRLATLVAELKAAVAPAAK